VKRWGYAACSVLMVTTSSSGFCVVDKMDG
jgi:hypothetical protein